MVYIGSARGDENGRIRGGQAGDQTGREVCTEPWYNSRLGWRVFRAKDPQVAKMLADDMQYACDNDFIGYDQSQNQTLYHVVKFLDWNCSKVDTYCETDCSQLVRVCILYAGVPIGMFSTADEPSYLLGTGAFEELTGPQYTSSPALLKRGDILCTRQKGHTVIVMNDGDGIGQKVDEDGLWGTETTKATQILYGTPADGEIWKQSVFNKRYLPHATTGWKFGLFCGSGSPVVKEIQKTVGATPDGIMGKNTVQHLQVFLANLGYYDGSIDGIMGYKTVIGWQRYINSI
jgi:peptidoglycan hydrolase-like protein with peptidoglycan-binding domain